MVLLWLRYRVVKNRYGVHTCIVKQELPHLRHSPCDYHLSCYTGEKAYIVESIIVYTEEGSRATYDQWVCLPSAHD